MGGRISRLAEKSMKVVLMTAADGMFVKMAEGSYGKEGFALLVGWDFGAVSARMVDVEMSRDFVLGKARNVDKALMGTWPVKLAGRMDVDAVADPARGLVLKCLMVFRWTDMGIAFKDNVPAVAAREIEGLVEGA